MKSFIAILGLVPAVLCGVLDARQAPSASTKCIADNCARAVTGTFKGNPTSFSRVNTDCSSFQRATVYAPVTITTTSGSVSTTVMASSSGTVTPSSIPAYAQTACTSGAGVTSRFASACSCAGVTKTTTTIVPTATVVVPVAPFLACPDQAIFDTCPGNQDCYCFENADSSMYCAQGSPCSGGDCNSDADCNGGKCSINTGCGPQGVCVAAGYYSVCVNQASPARLFKVRADSGKTTLG